MFCPNCDSSRFVAYDCAVVVNKEGGVESFGPTEAFDPFYQKIGVTPEALEFVCEQCGARAE